MHPRTQLFSPEEGREYLANLLALSAELEIAMHCIARQELLPLRESIRTQQAACSRLAHMQRGRSMALLCDDDQGEGSLNSDLALQVREAIAVVVLLNRRYAALLRHSGETLRLFAGLFRSYQGLTQPTSSFQVKLPTWSCEV